MYSDTAPTSSLELPTSTPEPAPSQQPDKPHHLCHPSMLYLFLLYSQTGYGWRYRHFRQTRKNGGLRTPKTVAQVVKFCAVELEILPPAVRAGESERSEARSEEHTSELQSRQYLVCRLLLEK